MNKLIVANWKLNPTNRTQVKKLVKASDVSGVVVAPPFIYLELVEASLKNAKLGAQDVFWEDSGAFTGEVSPLQLKDMGVAYVIVGHSERRDYFKETDNEINKKVIAVLKARMKVILCVGEHIEIRKKGIGEAKKFITGQLKVDLKGVGRGDSKNIIVAYEPIWAIGSGTSDIPEEAAEIASYIKNLVNIKGVLYGGSVNSKNAKEFLEQDEIDGALIGGASLKPKEFIKILQNI